METHLGCVYVIYDKLNLKSLFGETRSDGDSSLARHRSNLRSGNERNKPLQEDYYKHGESRFIFEVIIESSDHKLCELLLIELFSRVGMAYNSRRGDEITKVERGEKDIPAYLYSEIKAYIHRRCSESPNYKELLNELEDLKTEFESKSEKIYQREFKNTFLNSKYSYDTQRVVKALFRNTEEFETLYGKDLYDFNYDELKAVLKSFKTTTIRSLQNQVSTIERYIEFARKNGKTTLKGVNYAKKFDSKDVLENLLDKDAEENMVFDRDEIMQMAMMSDNAQDGVILGLLFDGVSHKNEFEELTNLSKDNIDMENKRIKLLDRTISMSTKTAVLVKGALDQTENYTSITGDNVRNYKIAEGNNILRGLRGKNKIKGDIVSQRIVRNSEINDYDYLNATNISYSGQLHYVKQLIEEENDEVEEAIDKALYRFGMPINTSSQYYLKERIDKYLELSKCIR